MADQQEPENNPPNVPPEETEKRSGSEEKELDKTTDTIFEVRTKTVVSMGVSLSGFQATSRGRVNPFSAGFSYHTHTVNALMFSPTENLIAFSCGESNLYICDIAEQGQLHSYPHPGGIHTLAWSPDGRYLASISSDEQATYRHIWEVASGKQLHVYEQPGHVRTIQWSPDGQRIATAGWGQTVQIWNPFSGEQLLAYSGHAGPTEALAWSPDGMRIVSGGDNGLHVWDAASGALITIYYGHFGWVRAAAWSPDGEYIISGGGDLTIQVWHARTRERLFTHRQPQEQITAVQWSPDGKHIVFATWDGSVQEREIVQEQGAMTDQYSFLLRPHLLVSEIGIATAWKEDLSLIAFGGADLHVEVADLVNAKLFLCRGSTMPVELIGQRTIVPEAEAVIQKTTSIATDTTTTTETIQPGPGGPRVLQSSTVQRRSVKAWGGHDLRDMAIYYGHLGAVRGLVWSPDGTRIASASHDGTIQVWNARTRKTSFTYRGHMDPVVAVAWSPDGQRLASGSLDKTAKVWDVLTGQVLQTYHGHSGFVYSVAWSPDGKHVASSSADHEVHVWDAANGETPLIAHVHSAPVTAVSWSPDGRYLASGSEDQLVQVQEIATQQTVFTYRGHRGHRGGVQALAWSPDGTRIASGGGWYRVAAPEGNATLHIWSATGEGHVLLCGNKLSNTSWKALAWSPDGTMVATTTLSSFIEIYDATTGEKAAQISNSGRPGRQHGENLSLAWSPDGTRIAAGSSTTEVKIWRTE